MQRRMRTAAVAAVSYDWSGVDDTEILSTPGAGTRVVAGFPLRVDIPAG